MIACNVKATGCNFCEPYRERLSEEQEKRKNVTDREQVKKHVILGHVFNMQKAAGLERI